MAKEVALSLEATATRIREELAEVDEAWGVTVQHAIRVGELLHDAKAQLAHGAFMPWVQEHTSLAQRTANDYMQLADGQQEVAGAQSIHGALRQLAKANSRSSANLGKSKPAKAPKSWVQRIRDIDNGLFFAFKRRRPSHTRLLEMRAAAASLLERIDMQLSPGGFGGVNGGMTQEDAEAFAAKHAAQEKLELGGGS